MKVCLVTGGGGFLGKTIVKQLLAKNLKVKIMARNKYPELDSLGVEGMIGDIRDASDVDDACKGVDTVFHTAALTGLFANKHNIYDVNVKGTENIINACVKNNVKALVYTSSPSVVFGKDDLINADETTAYPEKYLAYYPETKAIAEKMILSANSADEDAMKTLALRPHLIWGPGDNHLIPKIIERAKQNKLIQVGDGKNLVDIVFVENAATAHILAAENLHKNASASGNAYFISDSQPVNLWEWINDLLSKLNISPVKKQISLKKAFFIGFILECVYKVFNIKSEPKMTRFIALQLAKSHYFSNEKARKDLNYKPVISNEEGIKRLLNSFEFYN